MPDPGRHHHATEGDVSRRITLWLLTVGVGIILAIVTAEVILRTLGLAPVNGLATVTEREFNRIPGLFTPSQAFVSHQVPALPHTITIDTLGFRVTGGGDRSHGPPTILYIGDSYTFGDFVDDVEALPAQFEKALGDRCGGTRVINAGVGGTTIGDHLHILNRTLSQEPDLVVLQFSENDVHDLLGIPSAWDRLAYNRRLKSSLPLSIVYPTLRRTALWNTGLRTLGAIRERRKIQIIDPLPAERQDSITGVLRDQYRQTLYAFRDSVTAHGMPLLLVMFPAHFSVERGDSEQLNWLEAIARDGNIAVVNLIPPLATTGLPSTELYLLPIDGHAAPRGYRIAADFLAAHAFADSLLGRTCSPVSPL